MLLDEIKTLEGLRLGELRRRYRALFRGDPPPARGESWLRERIAWRLQANAAASDVKPPPRPDLPPAGTVITRPWHGRELELRVLERGFELDGVVHRTLSAAAKAVTGAHWNGTLFWGLKERKRKV